MTTGPLIVTVADGVAVLEIDRPPVNYFDVELIGALAAALNTLDEDPACRVLLLCAKGKHFCAGADFAGTGDFTADRAGTARTLYEAAAGIFTGRKPIVAAVQGAAIGGGLGLACAADFRVAEPSTRFSANFAMLGIHQGFGSVCPCPRSWAGSGRATCSCGVRPSAARRHSPSAWPTGPAEPGLLRETAASYARELAAAAPLAVMSIRETLRGDLPDRVRAALERELPEQTWLWDTADATEGIAAAARRRPPIFRGV